MRQQAITWANVDPDLCRHMMSLGHNELIVSRGTTWWHHDMETLPILLAFYEGNPLVTGGFTYHRASNVKLQCFLMMTSSNGNIFHVTGHLCGEFTCHRWISHTKASDAELWFFFDLRPNKRFSKQSWGWWFDMPSPPLWHHCNVVISSNKSYDKYLSCWWFEMQRCLCDITIL